MLLEQYYKNKIKYKDYIILIKCGNFYETIDKDSIIFNKLFGYKLNKLSDTFKCGFPVNSLENILSKLEDKRLNYIVISNEKIINNKKFKDNIYNNFNFETNDIVYKHLRIKKIIKYLNDNIFNDINDLLINIERLING